MTVIDTVKTELIKEADAILAMAENLDSAQIEKAFQLLSKCRGKVVLTGIGKAGIIARKISATLESTGTSSVFLHAAEGIHGDLGMISKEDTVIAVSNSGNTPELLAIIPFIRFHEIPLISITANADSQLAKASDALLLTRVDKELEPLGMVPTASTTAALAMGDALAIALLNERNFSLQDFALFHPGGVIGKRLLLKVEDLMHTGAALPKVSEQASLMDAILEMSGKKLGCTIVEENSGKLLGIITDGDLRRQIQNKKADILSCSAQQCMTPNPKSITPYALAVSALNLMQKHSITVLIVADASKKVLGILHMHDLIKAGVV